MAVVYPWCNDRAAHSRDCRWGMAMRVDALFAAAQGRLRGPTSDRPPFHSRIRLEHDHIDHYIVLEDWASDVAAAAIEYGRKRGNRGTTPGKGVFGFLSGLMG